MTSVANLHLNLSVFVRAPSVAKNSLQIAPYAPSTSPANRLPSISADAAIRSLNPRRISPNCSQSVANEQAISTNPSPVSAASSLIPKLFN